MVYSENDIPDDMPMELREKFWRAVLMSASAAEAMLKIESMGIFDEKCGQYTLREIVDSIFRLEKRK